MDKSLEARVAELEKKVADLERKDPDQLVKEMKKAFNKQMEREDYKEQMLPKKSNMDLQDKKNKLTSKKRFIMKELGEEKFNEIVGVISRKARELNLDTTPDILEDVLEYTVEIIRANNSEERVAELEKGTPTQQDKEVSEVVNKIKFTTNKREFTLHV